MCVCVLCRYVCGGHVRDGEEEEGKREALVQKMDELVESREKIAVRVKFLQRKRKLEAIFIRKE